MRAVSCCAVRLMFEAYCTGRQAQRDGIGNRYDYRVIVVAGGGG